MPSRETFQSLCVCGAILALVAWNALLQTKLTRYEGHLEERSQTNSGRMKRSANNQSPSLTGGATYVRWGRTVCPSDAELVYKGFAGGEYYTHEGGSAEYVCLSGDPKYARFTSAEDAAAWIHGVELQLEGTTGSILETTNANSSPLQNSDVQCAVCRSRARTSMVMIPGTNQCSPGWTAEYWGYLMTGRDDFKAQHSYACLDKAPERGTDGGVSNDNGAMMFHVQGKCGSLPCGPYVANQELTCVVCTK